MEISGEGATVKIRIRPTVIVSDHSEDDDIQYQNLQDDMIELYIDKAKRFAFRVGDINKAQNDINVIAESLTDAGYQLKIAIERSIFSVIYGDAGQAIPQTALDKTNIVDWIIKARTLLAKKNIPPEDRALILPPDATGIMLGSDLKNAALMGDGKSILLKSKHEFMGTYSGFNIFESNNLTVTSSGVFQAFALHKSAVTFASQITKTETLRLQQKMGDAARGLNVYGFKVNFPDGLVSMPCTVA